MGRGWAAPVAFLASVGIVLGACSLTTDLGGFAEPATQAAAADGGIALESRDGGDAGDAGAVRGYREEVMADSPIAFYRLGERASSAPAVDEVAGRAGTYQGAVVLGRPGAIAGDANGSADFDGVSGQVIIDGDFAGFGDRSSFTVEAWIRPTTIDLTYRRIVSNEGTDGNGRQGWLFWAVGQRGAEAPRLSVERYRDDVEENVAYTQQLKLGVWTHVAVTCDGSTLAIYVDGTRAASKPTSYQLLPQRRLRIGAANDETGLWAGGLDEIAIYDRALTPERLAAHFEAGREKR